MKYLRRDFLRLSSTGLGGIALVPLAQPQEPPRKPGTKAAKTRPVAPLSASDEALRLRLLASARKVLQASQSPSAFAPPRTYDQAARLLIQNLERGTHLEWHDGGDTFLEAVGATGGLKINRAVAAVDDDELEDLLAHEITHLAEPQKTQRATYDLEVAEFDQLRTHPTSVPRDQLRPRLSKLIKSNLGFAADFELKASQVEVAYRRVHAARLNQDPIRRLQNLAAKHPAEASHYQLLERMTHGPVPEDEIRDWFFRNQFANNVGRNLMIVAGWEGVKSSRLAGWILQTMRDNAPK